MFNALLSLNRTGIAWKYLPHDFPPHGTVYHYYAAWRDEGLLAQSMSTHAAKLIVGRKRSTGTDALGLLLAVVVCAASLHENNAGIQVLN